MSHSIAVSINATHNQSLEVEEADSVEVRIKDRLYIVSSTERGHLRIEAVDEQSMRVTGFSNMVTQQIPSERITQGEIIVGNTVDLS